MSVSGRRGGGEEVVIAGWDSHPDAIPRGPSLWDDEFDAPLSSVWAVDAAAMAPASFAVDANKTHESHLTVRVTGGGSNGSVYLWRPSPPAPFTVTAKIAATSLDITNPQDCGLGVGQANPNNGFVQAMTPSSYSGGLTSHESTIWSDLATFLTTIDVITTDGYGGPMPPYYLQLVVASATSVRFRFSADGRLFAPLGSAYNPQSAIGGWTPGSVVLSHHAWAGKTVEGVWDWVRVTTP